MSATVRHHPKGAAAKITGIVSREEAAQHMMDMRAHLHDVMHSNPTARLNCHWHLVLEDDGTYSVVGDVWTHSPGYTEPALGAAVASAISSLLGAKGTGGKKHSVNRLRDPAVDHLAAHRGNGTKTGE